MGGDVVVSEGRKYPTTSRGYEGLMRHDVPRARRSKPSRAVSTKPPRCDVCGKWRAPGIDHSECVP